MTQQNARPSDPAVHPFAAELVRHAQIVLRDHGFVWNPQPTDLDAASSALAALGWDDAATAAQKLIKDCADAKTLATFDLRLLADEERRDVLLDAGRAWRVCFEEVFSETFVTGRLLVSERNDLFWVAIPDMDVAIYGGFPKAWKHLIWAQPELDERPTIDAEEKISLAEFARRAGIDTHTARPRLMAIEKKMGVSLARAKAGKKLEIPASWVAQAASVAPKRGAQSHKAVSRTARRKPSSSPTELYDDE